jgi:hypothetical protein
MGKGIACRIAARISDGRRTRRGAARPEDGVASAASGPLGHLSEVGKGIACR